MSKVTEEMVLAAFKQLKYTDKDYPGVKGALEAALAVQPTPHLTQTQFDALREELVSYGVQLRHTDEVIALVLKHYAE